MAKFQMKVVLSDDDNYTTARVADGVQTNHLNDNDIGKFVKMIGDSQYGV